MKRSVASLLACSTLALATGFAGSAAAQNAPPPEHSLTGNLALSSSYRFRGIDQTFGKPALQGGFDYAHSSGFYAGNWNSNVNSGAGYPDGNLEMDFYGGYKRAFGDVGLDIGALYYYYPGSEARGLSGGRNTGAVNNKEIYLGGSWKFLSLKYFHALDDYFSARGNNGERTRGSNYIDLAANYDLGGGWGIGAHVGRLRLKNVSNGDYTDWKLGVTKDFSGWIVGASYVDTDAKGSCGSANQPYCFSNSASDNGAGGITPGSRTKDAGRGIAVLSVGKTF